MNWFRCYSEFATDSKVQILPENMQRRLIMLFCLRCSNALATLHATEIAFSLRITEQELEETKMLFISKGFIDNEWNIVNWDKRQYVSDTSTERSRKHREKKKESMQQPCNVAATPPEQNRAEQIQNRAEEKEPLSNFKNKILNEEMKKFAEDKGVFGKQLETSWQRFLIKKGSAMIEKNCSYEQFFVDWQLWILNERIEDAPANEETALVGEDLKIQHLGSAAWRRKRDMSLNPDQKRILDAYESINGDVWWTSLREFKNGKK